MASLTGLTRPNLDLHSRQVLLDVLLQLLAVLTFAGDVLGIYIETGTSTLSFSVNDKFLGTPVFPNFICKSNLP